MPKKSDLKNGCIVELNSGHLAKYIDDPHNKYPLFCDEDNSVSINQYTDDLRYKPFYTKRSANTRFDVRQIYYTKEGCKCHD